MKSLRSPKIKPQVLSLRKLRAQKGQALVETVLVILLFFGMYFGLIQMFLLAMVKMSTFDAAYSAARSEIVGKPKESAYTIFIAQPTFGKTFFPIISSEQLSPVQDIKNSAGQPVYITNGKVSYMQKVMFKDFFSMGFPFVRGESEAWMLNSPEPEYFGDKSFKP